MENKTVWIIGAGALSHSYVQVLRHLGYDPLVISRGDVQAKGLEDALAVKVVTGGLQAFLSAQPGLPIAACVVTGIENLASTTSALISYGVKNVLCEKPGALSFEDLSALAQQAKAADAACVIGYNRRCYASTQKAMDMLKADGGVTSFHFEFTEWSERLENLKKAPGVMEAFVLGNSSHVLDLAFYLGGWPVELNCVTGGKDELKWHPASSRFAGSGRTGSGALFSYHANWNGPGRWGVEVLSKSYRLILRPMEELSVINRGTLNAVRVELDDEIDRAFKHGMHRQLELFLSGQHAQLCSLNDQLAHWPVYARIAGYG